MAAENFRVPLVPLAVVMPGNTRTGTYRHLLTVAMRAGVEPDDIDLSGMASETLRFYGHHWTAIEVKADELGWPIGKVFAGWCSAGQRLLAQEQSETAKRMAGRPDIAVPFATNRPEQMRYFTELVTSLADKRMVMLEGSTGIGKGRAVVAAAVERVHKGVAPIVIAAPTVVLVGSLFREYLALPEAFRGKVSATILPGASEFVDDVGLMRYFAEAEVSGAKIDEGVKAWLDAGGPSGLGRDHPFCYCGNGIPPVFLADDFRHIVRDMPTRDFLLSECDNANDSMLGTARPMLASYRLAAHGAQIIFCTHTMLALAHKLKWTIMRKPKMLLVDEAHLFEEKIADVHSSQLSFHSLRIVVNRAKGTGLIAESAAKAALADIHDTMSILSKLGSFDNGSLCLTGSRVPTHHIVDDLTTNLERLTKTFEILGKKTPKKGTGSTDVSELASDLAVGIPPGQYRRFMDAISDAIKALTRVRQDRVEVTYSPDKRFPSLTTGPSTVSWVMQDLWACATEGVAFISATLYIMDRDGNQKCDYLGSLLSVDHTRLYTPAPVIAKMIYSLPTLHVPSAEWRRRLVPPSHKDEVEIDLNNRDASGKMPLLRKKFGKVAKVPEKLASDEKIWLESVSEVIGDKVAPTARGGSLVLCTSYTQVEVLGASLMERIGPDRLVIASPNRKFVKLEDEFRERYRAGLRPILIGLGAAWTGVSLIDQEGAAATDPTKDTLLTDVVVVRLPVGLNRSNAMSARIDRLGTYPIANEALLVFKQGLGRLIRRDGVEARRLWVLDSRIWREWPGMETLAGGARRLLAEYRKKLEF